MIALYIILGLLALIVALCFVKLKFEAQYADKFELKLKVLFLTFDILPLKKKPEKKVPKKKKESDKNKEKNPSNIKKLSDKKGVDGLVSTIVELSELALTTLKSLFEKVVIETLNVDITVVGEDAADTALKYGKLCGVFYSAVATLCGVAKCEEYNLNVTPNFDDEAKADVKAYSKFYIRTFYVLRYALSALIKLLVIRYKR